MSAKQNASIENILAQNKIMIIDGSMSTALEKLGVNLNSKLWTAKCLEEAPDLVKQVHLDYFRAGADCGITCSYQATIPGLMQNGCTREQAEELIARSVTLFVEARDQWWKEEGEAAGRVWPLCLAGIGPYGAYLADGSEYRGISRKSWARTTGSVSPAKTESTSMRGTSSATAQKLCQKGIRISK